jgi:hypothetical protein
VSAKTKRLARIDRDHLVNAVAENESSIEHRNDRVFDWHELAVQINHKDLFSIDVISIGVIIISVGVSVE